MTANRGPLFTELRWFIRLRWLEGAAVIAGALIKWFALRWFDRGPVLLNRKTATGTPI